MFTRNEWLRWWGIAGILAFNVAGIAAGRVSLAADGAIAFAVILGLTTLGVAYRLMGRDERIARTLIVVSQFLLFPICLAVASYIALSFNRPLVDAQLFAFDKAIGFNWLETFRWTYQLPVVKEALVFGYNSSVGQIAVLTVAMPLAGYVTRTDRFLLALLLGGIVTVAVWGVFPSLGSAAYVSSLGGHPDIREFWPVIDIQNAILSGTLGAVKLSDLDGIVGAPSYHTIMALLTIWAVRGLGWWAVPFYVLSSLALIAVPTFGGHHLADLLISLPISYFVARAADRLVAAEEQEPGTAAQVPTLAVAPSGDVVR